MVDKQSVVKEVRALFERDPAVNIHQNPIEIEYNDGTLVIKGEVTNIAAKRRAQQLIQALRHITAVEDRVRVKPAEPKGDGALRDSLMAFFAQEAVFHNCTVRVRNKQRFEAVIDNGTEAACRIDIGVENGVVTLSGEVISLTHKRLAVLLAWWVPGVCDVIDCLQVVPDQSDSDGEINEAVQVALSKDPLVRNEAIRVFTTDRVVTLQGVVRGEAQRQMAEADVWYLGGVERVFNQLRVHS